jgi:hypothetical protein
MKLYAKVLQVVICNRVRDRYEDDVAHTLARRDVRQPTWLPVMQMA